MKKPELINTYRQQITEAMVDCYRTVLESFGRIQYKIYIWEDGEIETLEDVQGSNTWLQPKSSEPRKLFYVTTIESPCFNPFDYTDESEPEDEDEKGQIIQQVVDYLVDEYDREGASDVLDSVLDEAEQDEEDWQ